MRLLLIVISDVNIQLRNIHRHLQKILRLFQRTLQFGDTDVIHVMRLVSVGINRCAGISQSLYQFTIFCYIPPNGVVVVVDKDGIGIALVCHLESLDQPVVARLTRTTHGSFYQRVSRLVHTNCLVDNVDEGQCSILLPDGVKPRLNGIKAILDRQALEPTGVLCAPKEGMELVSEPIFLGIVKGSVASPIETVTVSLY